MNPNTFNPQQPPQQTLQAMRTTSPTQNDPRRSFPVYPQKNPPPPNILQNSIVEAKIHSPHNGTQFGNFPEQNVRNKTGELLRNPQEQSISSPTKMRSSVTGPIRPATGNNGLLSAPVTSSSPSRNKTANNSFKNQNFVPKPPQQYLSTPFQPNSQPQNLSTSGNHGTAPI